MLNPRSRRLTRPFFFKLAEIAIFVKALLFLLFDTLVSAMVQFSILRLQVILFCKNKCLNCLWIKTILVLHLYISLFILSLFVKVSKKLKDMYLYLALLCFTHSFTTLTSFKSFFLACSVLYFQSTLRKIPMALMTRQKILRYRLALRCSPYFFFTVWWEILNFMDFTMLTADSRVNQVISRFM